MMTIAQKIEERSKIEVAKRLLADRHDLSENDLIKWVNKMTGLPEEKIRDLKKKH